MLLILNYVVKIVNTQNPNLSFENWEELDRIKEKYPMIMSTNAKKMTKFDIYKKHFQKSLHKMEGTPLIQ